jgi:hypothetical protein
MVAGKERNAVVAADIAKDRGAAAEGVEGSVGDVSAMIVRCREFSLPAGVSSASMPVSYWSCSSEFLHNNKNISFSIRGNREFKISPEFLRLEKFLKKVR